MKEIKTHIVSARVTEETFKKIKSLAERDKKKIGTIVYKLIVDSLGW
jgi:hypothetical protein